MGKSSIFYTNDCPYTNSEMRIRLDYDKPSIFDQVKTDLKYHGYTCDLIEECPYPSQDPLGRCPVAINFFKSVNESF